MKKKDFMTKVTMIDILVVSILLITGLTVPAFQNLITSIEWDILVYGVLSINMVVDLMLLVLNKLKKTGSIIKNVVIFFILLKLLVLFMASFVSITIGFAN